MCDNLLNPAARSGVVSMMKYSRASGGDNKDCHVYRWWVRGGGLEQKVVYLIERLGNGRSTLEVGSGGRSSQRMSGRSAFPVVSAGAPHVFPLITILTILPD